MALSNAKCLPPRSRLIQTAVGIGYSRSCGNSRTKGKGINKHTSVKSLYKIPPSFMTLIRRAEGSHLEFECSRIIRRCFTLTAMRRIPNFRISGKLSVWAEVGLNRQIPAFFRILITIYYNTTLSAVLWSIFIRSRYTVHNAIHNNTRHSAMQWTYMWVPKRPGMYGHGQSI